MLLLLSDFSMREIALDTETTGLSVENGDRITEIGCVEIVNKRVTGKFFHVYVNPEREVSREAQEISGLTYEFLKSHKKFNEVYTEFLDFIKDSRLIIHNAIFDIGFLNFELEKSRAEIIKMENVINTLTMAKQKFPGSPATLDALCKRFSIDASKRIKHGALIDAELLAEVYINMSVRIQQKDIFSIQRYTLNPISRIEKNLELKVIKVSESELNAHNNLLKKIKEPIWTRFQ
ncbi:MAG: DNA polymerase III subunit epsilon [Holosporales bacterium]|jgi:DNA polymerase-3 subunit epsilon|nr:DNA polymerase III subunit epsilon [Holosporales bacterium]